jgi:hypothetical protein
MELLKSKKDMLAIIAYLQKQLDKCFDTIDELNRYIFALQSQIKEMGEEPIERKRKGGDVMYGIIFWYYDYWGSSRTTTGALWFRDVRRRRQTCDYSGSSKGREGGKP